jgi:hypothetical protein
MTQPGIGGGGLVGLAIEVLPPPETLTAVAAAGGTLVDDEYFYVVTAVNSSGETVISNEDSATTATTNNSVLLDWDPVLDAQDVEATYNVYRSLTTGGPYQTLTTGVATSTFTDDGTLTPAAPAPPTVNTALAYGVYTAPTKFFPINSESLKFNQGTIFRRPIRQSVDVVGAVPGNVHSDGDLEIEALEDVVPYFILASRVVASKVTTGSDIVYTFTPTPNAIPVLSLSITVVRNEEVFGYTGCVTGQFSFTPSDGLLMFNVSLVGSDEIESPLPIATWPTTVPFGAGQYEVNIAGTQMFDTDTFEFTVNDNAEPQFRLKDTGRGAQYIKFGERECTITMERDFFDRTEYDQFKTLTQEEIFVRTQKLATNYIKMTAPVAVKDSYEVGLSGQGELVRANIEYQNMIDTNGDSFIIEIGTQEDIDQVEEAP